MKNKVLVTGISGFVGQHCALELLKQGYQVKGSVRNRSKEAEVREVIAELIDPKNHPLHDSCPCHGRSILLLYFS